MAKKKKGKGKKKAATKVKKVDPMLEEIKTLPLEEVTARHNDAQAKLKDIRRKRNYYMLERDAVQQYHYVVCGENEELKRQLKNLESRMEAVQKAHKDEIQIYLQKVTHVKYEHGHNMAMVDELHKQDIGEEQLRFEAKREAEVGRKREEEDLLEDEQEASNKKIKMKQQDYKDQLDDIRKAHMEAQARLKSKYEQRLNTLLGELELRRRIETHELEERKNDHLNSLISNHDKAFEEMRSYYNRLTRDNLGLIKALQEELADLKVKQGQHEKTIEDYRERNKELETPKKEAETIVGELQEKLKCYQKDKASLKLSRQRIVVLEEEYRKECREHKKLEENYNKLQDECKELYETFQEVVLSVQKQAQAENSRLGGHLKSRQEIFEKKKAQFSTLLEHADMDSTVLQKITAKLDAELTEKNAEAKELSYENAKISKAHDDLVRVYEAKLKAFGIPEQERNLRPLQGSTSTAPADLIV